VPLDIPKSHRDLLEADVGTFATVDDDGLPQLTEVWFLHENGEVKLSFNTERAKTRNLQARPQCSLLIVDLGNPYRYLELRGRAKVEPDDDYAFASRIGQKYGGADVREYDPPGAFRIVVTLEPTKVHAVDMSG
jgi:PPOX class probable F420-dependent enzyme